MGRNRASTRTAQRLGIRTLHVGRLGGVLRTEEPEASPLMTAIVWQVADVEKRVERDWENPRFDETLQIGKRAVCVV